MKYLILLIPFVSQTSFAQSDSIIPLIFIGGSPRGTINRIDPSPGDRFFYRFNGKEFCDFDSEVKLTICEYQVKESNHVWLNNITMSDKQFRKLHSFLNDEKNFNCGVESGERFSVYQVKDGRAIIGAPVNVPFLRSRVKQFFKSAK